MRNGLRSPRPTSRGRSGPAPSTRSARRPQCRAYERVPGRDSAVTRDAEDLPELDMAVASGVVRGSAPAACVVAAAVADADVQVAVRPEREVAGVVVPAPRLDVVHEHDLAGGIDDVAGAEHEKRDAVHGPARRTGPARSEPVPGVVEVHEPVAENAGPTATPSNPR